MNLLNVILAIVLALSPVGAFAETHKPLSSDPIVSEPPLVSEFSFGPELLNLLGDTEDGLSLTSDEMANEFGPDLLSEESPKVEFWNLEEETMILKVGLYEMALESILKAEAFNARYNISEVPAQVALPVGFSLLLTTYFAHKTAQAFNGKLLLSPKMAQWKSKYVELKKSAIQKTVNFDYKVLKGRALGTQQRAAAKKTMTELAKKFADEQMKIIKMAINGAEIEMIIARNMLEVHIRGRPGILTRTRNIVGKFLKGGLFLAGLGLYVGISGDAVMLSVPKGETEGLKESLQAEIKSLNAALEAGVVAQ